MDKHIFAETSGKRIRSGMTVLIAGAFIVGLGYFFLSGEIFPRYSQRIYPIIITVVAAAAVIGFAIYSMFIKKKQAIEVSQDKVVYLKGDQVIGEYPFAVYDFTSHITRYRTNGIVTHIERKLVISDGRSNKNISCPFLNRDEFSKMMALIDNLSLQHSHQQTPVATAETQNETTTVSAPTQSVAATYQLAVNNIKMSVKWPLIVVFGLVFFLEALTFYFFMDDFDTRRGMTTFMILTLVLVGAGVIIAGSVLLYTYSQKKNAIKRTPKRVDINQMSISFDQDTYVLNDILAIEAIPVSYNTPANHMRTVKITSQSKGIKTYNFGTRQDSKKYDDLIFSANEYADFLYQLRQAFINRPDVFSHNLENF